MIEDFYRGIPLVESKAAPPATAYLLNTGQMVMYLPARPSRWHPIRRRRWNKTWGFLA